MIDESERGHATQDFGRPADEFRASARTDQQRTRRGERPDEPDEVRIHQPGQAGGDEAHGSEQQDFADHAITSALRQPRQRGDGGDQQGNGGPGLVAPGREEESQQGRREEGAELESRTRITSRQDFVVLHQTFAQPEDDERREGGELQRKVIRVLRGHRIIEQQETDLRADEAQDTGRAPRATHHQDDAQEGDQGRSRRGLSGRRVRTDGEIHGDGGEDHRKLSEEFAPPGQGDEGDAQGNEELDDRGRSRAVADAHLIEAIGGPSGELPHGQTRGRDDLTEVRTLGGETETAPEKTGTDQRDFDDAYDGRDGGAQVQPETEEDDRGNGEDAGDTHGPPGAQRILALEVGRRKQTKITQALGQRIGTARHDGSSSRSGARCRQRRGQSSGGGHDRSRRHGDRLDLRSDGGGRNRARRARHEILDGLLESLDLSDQQEKTNRQVDQESQQGQDEDRCEQITRVHAQKMSLIPRQARLWCRLCIDKIDAPRGYSDRMPRDQTPTTRGAAAPPSHSKETKSAG